MSNLDDFLTTLGVNKKQDDFTSSILFSDSQNDTKEIVQEQQEEDDDQYQSQLTVDYILNKLQELEHKLEQHTTILQQLQEIPINKKRSFANEIEVMIHDAITQFIVSWNKSFRCTYFYRNQCKLPTILCPKIHDNVQHAVLAKEIRSFLLQSKSLFFQTLIQKCQKTKSEDTCKLMCQELEAIRDKFVKQSQEPNKSLKKEI